MSKRIKGITVEIGGDTTKLQDALKDVNKEIRSTESQLRDVNKLLKLDPGNTELLVQKHKLLGKAIDDTKSKLSSLKEAQTSANQALAQGTISQEQYDALQREIIETEQALKSLEKQAHASNSTLANVSIAGEQFQVAGDKVKSAGQKMMPVTATIAVLGVAAVKTSSDFDTAMSQVLAISGATGDEFDELRDKAREMGAKTKFSATDAAEAMNYMAMAGWKTSDMISGIDGVMNLAAASGEDLALTSDIITDALTAFGLQASDSAHFADVLAAASSNANTNVSMMGETFKYAAPIAGALGYTIEDTALAIGLMANAGIKSSQAGTSLRTIMTELQGDLVLTSSSFGEVMVQTINMDGSMRGLTEIMTDLRLAFSQMTEAEQVANAELLVGKQAMSGFLAIMNAAPSDVDKLTQSIINADGAAESMSTTMQDNLEGELEELMSALEEVAISFGDILMPAVRAIVRALNGFVNAINALPSPIKAVVAVILVLVAAIGPLLIIVGQMMTGLGSIMIYGPKLIGMLSGILSFITGSMIPAVGAVITAIGPIPLAIGAIVTAIVLLWNKSDAFREGVVMIWENIKQATVQAWDSIGLFLSETWTATLKGGKELWNNFTTFMTNFLSNLGQQIQQSWQYLTVTTHEIWTGIKQFLTSTWQSIQQTTSQIINGIGQFISKSWNSITQTTSRFMSGLFNIIQQVWHSISSTISNTMNAISQFISSAWNNIVSFMGNILSNAISIVVNAFNAILNNSVNAMNNLQDIIYQGFMGAVNFIRDLASQAVTWGWDMVIGIANGINQAIGHLVNSVKNVANIIWSYLHFSVPEVGPLTDYESWMPDFMQGLSKGIERSRHLVRGSINKVAQDMMISPQVAGVEIAGVASNIPNSNREISSLVNKLTDNNQGQGDIIIPVYLGGNLLDEVIVNAQTRQNIRSGGR
ncbi:phage tail tape measure protein [Fundicoccus culcitae]|uniref:Phage tail tape measure protein n=1 Tax=Fundicoccus culcitae TaxID=2969821 RepID=A0ABY5P7Z7_9LACT|nr:phage tail tape measure protein [Fundicoccus culcitae]UUX34867.1 phage tail tape measure protein [Fundicoccus culcitae]